MANQSVRLVGIAVILLSALAAAQTAPSELTQKLDVAAKAANRAELRLSEVVELQPQLPPDPCVGDQAAEACRQVRFVNAIGTDAEGMLSGVSKIDAGADTKALRRRLTRAAATSSHAEGRLEALVDDWAGPSGLPPDPCVGAVQADLEALATNAADTALRLVSVDTCDASASLVRRLGHVTASLNAASFRLDTVAADGLPRSGDARGLAQAELDAIIEQASTVLATAHALRGQ